MIIIIILKINQIIITIINEYNDDIKSLNSDEELNIISDENKIEKNEGSDNDDKSISSDLNNFIDIKDNNISMLVNNLEEKYKEDDIPIDDSYQKLLIPLDKRIELRKKDKSNYPIKRKFNYPKKTIKRIVI